MVARLRAVLLSLLVASLGGCGGGGNGTADAAVAGGGPSAGNMGTGGATATGGASSPATSGGRQVVSLPDAGTSEADGPVVLPPECVSGTSLVCPCLSGPPGVKVCTEEGRFSTCVCATNAGRGHAGRGHAGHGHARHGHAGHGHRPHHRGYRHVQAGTGRRRDDWLRMAKLGFGRRCRDRPSVPRRSLGQQSLHHHGALEFPERPLRLGHDCSPCHNPDSTRLQWKLGY